MNEFVMAAVGGGLIGLAASILLLSMGRVAGISGITGSIIKMDSDDNGWRISFLLGLLIGGVLLAWIVPSFFVVSPERPTWVLGVAGLFVGFGTQMGSGCTSGHGVCGISRFSVRSVTATIVFVLVGMVVATVLSGVFDG